MRRINMDYRNIGDIQKEISEVNDLINPLERQLIENPNNFKVKLDLESLKSRQEELVRELGFTKNHLRLTSFDLHISDKESKKIELKQLGNFCISFQDLIHSCAMFDGEKPIKKGASLDLDIKQSTNLQVDAVSSGSLVILVSPKDNQSTIVGDSLIEKSLTQITRIIDCGEDREKLTGVMKEIGTQPIYKYKNLLYDLEKDELTLDICYSVSPERLEKRTLTSDFATKVHKVIEEAYEEETDNIKICGKLYYVNVKSKECGIEIKDGDLEKNRNIKVNFRDSFKKSLKENLDLDISVSLERTVKFNPIEETSQDVFNLIEIL